MDARVPQRMQLSATRVDSDRFSRYPPSSSLRFSGRLKERQRQRLQLVVSADWLPVRNGRKAHGKLLSFEVSSSYKNFPASTLESGSFHNPFDEDLILKSKSQEIEPHLDGRSVYLVGMMGSGKTTVGKILSQALSYSFIDCDKLIEQNVNGTSVAEIFNLYGEDFFRDKETEELQKLSVMHQRVVSTGGGAVIRPINWKYMHKGISVWLDVPLEALAQRIASVGTDSRPLLHHESGDAYTQAFRRLTTLFEERGEAYANANARVSLENIATKRGYRDVCDITPTIIAIEALEQIEDFLGKGGVIA